jgi:hypothetical protein
MTSRSTPTSGGEHPAGNTRDGNAILTTDSIGILSRCKFSYFRNQTRVALVRNGLIRRYTGAMIYCSVITHKCIQLQSGESGSFPSSIGVMNIYGKEGPAVLSKLSHKKVVVTSNTNCHMHDGQPFKVLHTTAPACSFASMSDIEEWAQTKRGIYNPNINWIPVVNRCAVDLLGEQCAALPEQISNNDYGLIVVYSASTAQFSGNDMTRGKAPEVIVRCTGILYAPLTVKQLSHGDNPKFTDTAELRRLRRMGASYDAPPCLDLRLTRQLSHDDHTYSSSPLARTEDEETCIICFANPRQYKWNKCHHPNNNRGALVCNACYNKYRRMQSTGNNKREATSPLVSCPICRKPGRLVSARTGATLLTSKTADTCHG